MQNSASLINGKTQLLGIIGRNISYTVSPAIHNFSTSYLKINQIYVPFNLEADKVQDFLKFFWDVGGVGFSVTTPYKEMVAKLISDHSYTSVNTVYRGEQGWQATSTDAEGLAAGVSHLGLSFKSFSRFVILGNGGVVSAILAHIAKHFETQPEVIVLRRNTARDEIIRAALPSKFNLSFEDFYPETFARLIEGGAGETLVIQATSAPHQGDDLARFADGIKKFNGALVDVVYGAKSALIEAAKDRGIPHQDGLPMLIEQARVAQQAWWGKKAPYNEIFYHLTGETPKNHDDD